MTTLLTKDGKNLIDMEFSPGELPLAEAPAAPLSNPLVYRPTRRRIGPWNWLALASGALVLGTVVVGSIFGFARRAFETGSLYDLTLLVGTSALVVSIGALAAQQTRAYRRLKSAERARDLAQNLLRLGKAGHGAALLSHLRAIYVDNPIVLGQLNAADDQLEAHHSVLNVLDLLNREIFDPMDRAADAQIQKAALRATVGVSACPHPALDALVVAGIGLALVKDLMQIYGLRHGARAVWRIVSHVLFSASSTAVMSSVVEFAMKATHDRIATAVVGTAGEALVVARRIFALGMLAKAEIRPLPVVR